MDQSRESIVRNILQQAEAIFGVLSPSLTADRLSADITVSQLRVLLVLQTRGKSRMSDIASGLDVALSTATGLVDILVKKGLILRENDTRDRRQVICRLSEEGQQIINTFWNSGQSQMELLLEDLTVEQLEKAREVAEILLENVLRKKKEAAAPEG